MNQHHPTTFPAGGRLEQGRDASLGRMATMDFSPTVST